MSSTARSDNVSGIFEYRYQNTFEPAEDQGLDPNNHNMQVPEGTFLAGVKFDF